MKRYRSFIPLLLLIAIGIALIASGAFDRFRPETLAAEQASLQTQIVAHPVLAALAQIGAVTLSISTGIPGAVVLIFAGGMLFGVLIGTVLSTLGITLGAWILFLASRSAFGNHQGQQAPVLVERLRTGYLMHPASYTVLLRLVPFFPFGGVTVALAWLRCPLPLFLVATAGGGSVMTGIETALGAGLAKTIGAQGAIKMNLLTEPGVYFPLLALGLLALVPVVINKLRGDATKP